MTMAVVLQDERSDRGGQPVEPRHRDVPDTRSSRQKDDSPRVASVVLVAEDDASLRGTLAEILELEGHECLEAPDGEAALDMLRAHPVDVLVLDLHMPRRDGVSVLHEIDAPPPAVVIYSAFEFYSPEGVRSSVGPKVFRWLRKPSPPSQLIAAVAEALSALPGGA
jgi:two-component system, cell cycle response regulator CpdR